MELHMSGAGPHGLHRLIELDLPAVERDPVLLLECRRDVGVRHGTKQLAILPAPQFQYHLHGLELDGQCLRVIQLAVLALDGRGLDAIHLLLRALGRRLSQLAREQEVARITVGDLFRFAGFPGSLDILDQYDFHCTALRPTRSSASPRSALMRPRSPSRLRRKS